MKTPGFREVLNSADMCTPDGIGVVYAAKMLGTPVPERVAGFDLVCGLLSNIRKTGEGVFLFGAKPGVAEAAAVKLLDEYVGLNIVGVHHGYFSDNETDDIVKQINESGAKLLLVCLGAPKQEKWIFENKSKLTNVSLWYGSRRSFRRICGRCKKSA